MLPGRHLLYHRGIDDHPGTYITDYIYSGVCFVLCIHLLVRICREKKKIPEEQVLATSCCQIRNWLPWNWPKSHPTPVTMSTYGVLLVGVSNMMMSLLGGLAHQFLQTVEAVSDHHSNFPGWLTVWRFAASFSAVLVLGLSIMVEQLIVQERIFPIHRCVRRVYYVFCFLFFVAFLLFNFHPLMKDNEDPFSIGNSFKVCFAEMFLYGICTIVLLFKYYCCCCRKQTDHESIVESSPSHSTGKTSPVNKPCTKDLYDCCKSVAGGYHENVATVSSRSLEMFLTVAAPWFYVLAGAVNHLLKSTCADSDDAAAELGCPLPNSFNHNALLHVIQILSLICFFAAENISMTRRRLLCIRYSETTMKRTCTTSSVYNDVITSCTIVSDEAVDDRSPLKQKYLNNNNIPFQNRDDVLYKMEETLTGIVSSQKESDLSPMPKFPTTLHTETETDSSNKRVSVYDNLAQPSA